MRHFIYKDRSGMCLYIKVPYLFTLKPGSNTSRYMPGSAAEWKK